MSDNIIKAEPPPPERERIQWMQTDDGSMRVFAPGYQYSKPAPVAWVDVDSRGLQKLADQRVVKLDVDRESKPGRFIVKLNLPDAAALEHFDQLTQGVFHDRLQALKTVMDFEDQCRYASYDPSRPRTPAMEAYLQVYEAMDKARGEAAVTAGNLKQGGYGTTQADVDRTQADFEAKVKAYDDMMEHLREGYLRKLGFEPREPEETKNRFLHAQMPPPVETAEQPDRSGLKKTFPGPRTLNLKDPGAPMTERLGPRDGNKIE